MKISERKQRLRTRGTVPVSAEQSPNGKTVVKSVRKGSKAGPKSTTTTTQQRPARRPMSARFYIIFGIAYVIFSPVIFVQNLVALNSPHSKYHPGTLELLMPVLFFVFGVVWVYLGLRQRRRERAAAAGLVTTSATADKGASR
ncbi:MAG TPA: hypothetical protein VFE42_10775 [Chloroflexota bacterium]|nr:hypothetical protein [Chloroflexota bacterium]